MNALLSKGFWKQVFERAVKTAAQTAAGLLIADQTIPVDALSLDWRKIALVSLLAAGASIITSIGSIGTGEPDSPSVVKII